MEVDFSHLAIDCYCMSDVYLIKEVCLKADNYVDSEA